MVLRFREEEASLSANGTESLVFDVPEGKTFEIRAIAYSSTGAFKITSMENKGTGDQHVIGSLYSEMLKMNAGNVFDLTKLGLTITVVGSKLEVKVQDISGSANTVRLCLIGEER